MCLCDDVSLLVIGEEIWYNFGWDGSVLLSINARCIVNLCHK